MGANTVSRPKRSAPEGICGHRTSHREKFDPDVAAALAAAAQDLTKLERSRSARETAEDKKKAWKILSPVDDAILQARQSRSRAEAAEFLYRDPTARIRHKSSSVAELRMRKLDMLQASEAAYKAMKAEETKKREQLERTR